MADMQTLIDAILGDTKFAGNRNMAGKVYRDEPILRTASQLEASNSPRYRAMRRIAGRLYRASEERIFYEQGQFMADFEDDYEFRGEFRRYFPTYQAMSDLELRGYFSWRGRVRRGLVERTSLSFAFVYIYELLNQIGVAGPEEGFETLRNFRRAYGEIDPQINNYADLWLRDYVVYHRLDRSLLEGLLDDGPDRAALTLLNYRDHGAGEIFRALTSLSAYDLLNSRFYKKYPEEFQELAARVFGRLADHYERKSKKSLCEKFFGRIFAYPYLMFKSAVFYQAGKLEDFVYEINDVYKYFCQGGSFTCESLFRYQGKARPIGELLRSIDFLLRQKYAFKSALKIGKVNKSVQGIINQEIEKQQAEAGRRARNRVTIDLSKLGGIRQAALEIQNRLMLEEAPEPGPAAISGDRPAELASSPSDRPGPGRAAERSPSENTPALSDPESRFLGCLLSGRDYGGLLRDNGLMLSVLVEAVNEKFLETFGDTLIIYDGDRPELVEDYIEDLKRMISP